MDVIKQSYKYFKKIMPQEIIIVLLATLSIVIGLILPQFSALIIDKILYPALKPDSPPAKPGALDFLISGFEADAHMDKLVFVIAIMGSLLLINYVDHYVRWNLAHSAHAKVSDAIRRDAFRKFLDCSPRVLHSYSSGDLLNIMQYDIDNMQQLWSHRFIFLYNAIIAMIGVVVIMLMTNVYMAIVPFLLCIVSFFLSVSYRKKLRVCYNEIRDGNVDLNTCIQENINGVRIVRSFATEDDEMAKFEKKNVRFRDNYVNLSKLSAKYNMYFRLVGYGMVVSSMIIGIILAVRGDITVGQFTTFTTYTGSLNSHVISIAGQIGMMQNSMVAGRRLFGFLNADDGIDHTEEKLDMPERPSYKFENVTMTFDKVNALDNFSLDLPYGKKVGVMGKTGCGKSVMMRLINRFYDCTDGAITVDGKNIREYKLEEVRRATSFVSQDVFLFSETVANNIAFYDEGKDMEKIEHFASLAQVTKFIPRLSDGFDTVVGERGLGLSGGQKQRVSIARALYKEAPVLLLDDCTSALDYQTEKEIIDNIDEHYGEKTLIISSNRATSVSFCDEILYMEDGKILERGSHEELMALRGRYYAIYVSQTSGSEEEVA